MSDWLTPTKLTAIAGTSKTITKTQVEKKDPKKDSKKDPKKFSQKEPKKVTIDQEETSVPKIEHTNDTKIAEEEEGGEDPYVRTKDFKSLFIIKKQ